MLMNGKCTRPSAGQHTSPAYWHGLRQATLSGARYQCQTCAAGVLAKLGRGQLEDVAP